MVSRLDMKLNWDTTQSQVALRIYANQPIMTIASASQFHIYLLLARSSRGLFRDCENRWGQVPQPNYKDRPWPPQPPPSRHIRLLQNTSSQSLTAAHKIHFRTLQKYTSFSIVHCIASCNVNSYFRYSVIGLRM